MPLTQQELEALLREGEGPSVEFKRDLRQPGMLARLISAFANSGGGTILIGVEEANRVVGTDAKRIRTLLDRELSRLDPAPAATVETVDVAGKTVAAIRVPGLDRPVFSEGGAYARIGATTHPMSAADLAYALQGEPEPDRIGRLTEAVSRQTETIEHLRRDLAAASSLRSKLIDYMIGGVIGAILGALLTAVASKPALAADEGICRLATHDRQRLRSLVRAFCRPSPLKRLSLALPLLFLHGRSLR